VNNPLQASVRTRENILRMAFDGTDFVDTDYSGPRPTPPGGRAPTREELDAQLTGTQQQLAKLREAQDQLERARAAVEEMRRRRAEFTNGRAEMRQALTRGIGMLEKAELDARRDAEQLAKSLEGLRIALGQIERLNEQSWTAETWEQELTKALTAVENARMEHNAARLKWPVLDGQTPGAPTEPASERAGGLAGLSLGQLCKLGLALTWPLAVATILAAGAMAALLWLRR
jgi:DNA repair exonuclease SbcCD ATPase subunit